MSRGMSGDASSATTVLREGVFEARLAVETPERVQLEFELAGLGSRFAAGAIDTLLLALLWFVVTLLLVALQVLDRFTADLDARALAMAAIGVYYLLLWGYYLGFELLWGGQTPGKWIMKLRVVSEAGGPAPASAIFVRNLLRIVDVLPIVVVHLLGGIVMFLHGRMKRIGDLAAGTVVVRERALSRELRDLDSVAAPAAARREDDLDEEEATLVQRFVERRHELTITARASVAAHVVARLRERRELPEVDDERLLLLLDQGETPHSLRVAAGPAAPPPPLAVPDPPQPPEAEA